MDFLTISGSLRSDSSNKAPPLRAAQISPNFIGTLIFLNLDAWWRIQIDTNKAK